MFLLILLSISLNLFSYYQDIIINNNIIENGERSCEPTYKFIKNFLINYKRDFTVLDIGAAQGFFSFKIGYEFPNSTCVMIEGDYDYTNHTDKLLDLCTKNNRLDNIIFLKNLITPDLLQKISQCEHFDLILALNFIHHCGHDWKTIIEKIFSLGDYVIIENPPTQEGSNKEKIKRKNIENFILKNGGLLLGEVPRHTTSKYKAKVFLIKTNKSQLPKRNILWPPPFGKFSDNKFYYIKSDFSKKELTKLYDSNSITTEWHKGINLLTFKILNGIFPNTGIIREMLYDKLNILNIHKDLTPANIILQGKKIQIIDIDDFHYKDSNSNNALLKKRNQETFKIINKFLDLYQLKELSVYYWKNFTKIK